jgi:hypothetical protein
MIGTVGIATICAVAALPIAALAQNDPAYCAALGQKYERYVGDNDASHRGQQRDAGVAAAITQCGTNAAAAIPVIEKALKNARVDLPPRG